MASQHSPSNVLAMFLSLLLLSWCKKLCALPQTFLLSLRWKHRQSVHSEGLHTTWRPSRPSKCNLHSDCQICGRYFISTRLSASLHELRRNIFISYLHYQFLHSEHMQTNPVGIADIKVVGACPGNSLFVSLFLRSLFVRLLESVLQWSNQYPS